MRACMLAQENLGNTCYMAAALQILRAVPELVRGVLTTPARTNPSADAQDNLLKGSSNVAAILYQFPFYAGIMGVMIHTGLANYLAEVLIEIAEVETLPSLAFVIGGIVNFAIPSGGGEFAVIGPSILEATLSLAQDYEPEFQQALISKTILAITYGESLTNLLQPFFILMVLPVMSEGTNLQARDVMGYLVIPFILCFTGQLLLINLVGV